DGGRRGTRPPCCDEEREIPREAARRLAPRAGASPGDERPHRHVLQLPAATGARAGLALLSVRPPAGPLRPAPRNIVPCFFTPEGMNHLGREACVSSPRPWPVSPPSSPYRSELASPPSPRLLGTPGTPPTASRARSR